MRSFLNKLLPEGLDRDICNGDADEQALNLRDIIEPLQQPLSMLQKERRVALASPSLVVFDKMLQLVSTDRHPETSQKLPMSKQSTLPAAPTSAPLLPSDSIVPNPLSLNLPSIKFSRQPDGRQQPRGEGAAAAGPGNRQASFSFAPACQ